MSLIFSVLFSWNRWGNGKHPWKGKIDDIRIYNRALSDTEVIELYKLEALSLPRKANNNKLFFRLKSDE